MATVQAVGEQMRTLALTLIERGFSVMVDDGGLRIGDGGETHPELRCTWSEADGAAIPVPNGALSPAAIEEIYWANFYAHRSSGAASTFFDVVNAQPGLPNVVMDIGCGSGRDSLAFARSGRRVTGVDRADMAVRQARRAEDSAVDPLLRFAQCDAGDPVAVRTAIATARTHGGDAAMLFYARFFLHSIPADVQRTVLRLIGETARPGDWFAAEFRTEKDAARAKVHGGHFRRYQSGAAFRRELADRAGFATILLEQEGTGLSPYRGEDPHLYRVIARRDATSARHVAGVATEP